MPAPLPAHHRQGGAREVHDAEQTGLDQLAKFAGRNLLEGTSVSVPRIVDEHVETPKGLDCRPNSRLALLLDRHIEPEGEHLPSKLCD